MGPLETIKKPIVSANNAFIEVEIRFMLKYFREVFIMEEVKGNSLDCSEGSARTTHSLR
jgi:hypothetical protein